MLMRWETRAGAVEDEAAVGMRIAADDAVLAPIGAVPACWILAKRFGTQPMARCNLMLTICDVQLTVNQGLRICC